MKKYIPIKGTDHVVRGDKRMRYIIMNSISHAVVDLNSPGHQGLQSRVNLPKAKVFQVF